MRTYVLQILFPNDKGNGPRAIGAVKRYPAESLSVARDAAWNDYRRKGVPVYDVRSFGYVG